MPGHAPAKQIAQSLACFGIAADQKNKFFAANASDDRRFGCYGLQDAGELDQNLIAGCMAQCIIDRFEVVDIGNDDPMVAALDLGQTHARPAFQSATVENAGQRIGVAFRLQFLHHIGSRYRQEDKAGEHTRKGTEYHDALPVARMDQFRRLHNLIGEAQRHSSLHIEMHRQQQQRTEQHAIDRASTGEIARLNAKHRHQAAQRQVHRRRNARVTRIICDEKDHGRQETEPDQAGRHPRITHAHPHHHSFAKQPPAHKMESRCYRRSQGKTVRDPRYRNQKPHGETAKAEAEKQEMPALSVERPDARHRRSKQQDYKRRHKLHELALIGQNKIAENAISG